jgi:hypothetical protein
MRRGAHWKNSAGLAEPLIHEKPWKWELFGSRAIRRSLRCPAFLNTLSDSLESFRAEFPFGSRVTRILRNRRGEHCEIAAIVTVKFFLGDKIRERIVNEILASLNLLGCKGAIHLLRQSAGAPITPYNIAHQRRLIAGKGKVLQFNGGCASTRALLRWCTCFGSLYLKDALVDGKLRCLRLNAGSDFLDTSSNEFYQLCHVLRL